MRCFRAVLGVFWGCFGGVLGVFWESFELFCRCFVGVLEVSGGAISKRKIEKTASEKKENAFGAADAKKRLGKNG